MSIVVPIIVFLFTLSTDGHHSHGRLRSDGGGCILIYLTLRRSDKTNSTTRGGFQLAEERERLSERAHDYIGRQQLDLRIPFSSVIELHVTRWR